MPSPRFDLPPLLDGVFADVLLLEIEDDPTGLVNLIPNPSGGHGGYGWIDPSRDMHARLAPGGGPNAIEFIDNPPAQVTPTRIPKIRSLPFKVTGGDYIAARWEERGFTATAETQAASAYYAARLVFDVNGAVVASSLSPRYLIGTSTRTYAAVQVPAGATSGVIEYLHYSNATLAFGAVGGQWRHAGVTVATAATAAELVGLDYIDPTPTYTNIIDPGHSISVHRGGLDVGTLNAEVLDATLDPAVAPLIRPGKRCRLRVYLGGLSTVTLFTGHLTAAQVVYHYLDRVPDQKRARITLAATDPLARLAATPMPLTVGSIADLRRTLAYGGVPWNVNGSIDQIPPTSAAIVATSDNATLVDQVAITRDTDHGYAFITKEGRIQVTDPDHMPPGYVAFLDEAIYTPTVQASFDTDACINAATIVRRYIDADGETKEETTTWTDAGSIDRWGQHSATFTVAGAIDPAAFARDVFTANATPTRRLTGIRINIRDETFLEYAQLELYDRVILDHTDADISEYAYITSITHTITPTEWLVDLGFAPPTTVATPQQVPALGRSPVPGFATATLTGGWIPIGGSWAVPASRRDGPTVSLRGAVRDGGIASASVSLPPEHRPSTARRFIVQSSHAAGYSCAEVNALGQIILVTNAVGGFGQYYFLDGITFMVDGS